MLACSPKVDENGCLPNTVQGDDMCATDKVGVPEQAKEFCIKNPNALQCS